LNRWFIFSRGFALRLLDEGQSLNDGFIQFA
jgi:hypothetical protein